MTTLPEFLYRWIPRATPQYTHLKEVTVIDVGNNTVAHVSIGSFTLGGIGNTITARKYLDPDKGEGGNIVGFFEYVDNQSTREIGSSPGYLPMSSTWSTFGRDRDLVFVPMKWYTDPTSPGYPRPPLLYAVGDLDQYVTRCTGYLKVAKLGSLMETRMMYGQDAEWNFVADTPVKLPVIRFTFGSYTATNSFVPSSNYVLPTLIEYINTKVVPEIPGPAPPFAKVVNQFDACPGDMETGGGRRRRTLRKRRRRVQRRRTGRRYRNMLPRVAGS